MMGDEAGYLEEIYIDDYFDNEDDEEENEVEVRNDRQYKTLCR